MATAKLAHHPFPKRRIVGDRACAGCIERKTGGGDFFVVAGRAVPLYEPLVWGGRLCMERTEDSVGSKQARQPASTRRGSN
ncbi:MAG: hypothetical protein OXN96_14095 [Bryobacterales bacterium]|nr:hypothetical protein [Bryobacterales bacterium]